MSLFGSLPNAAAADRKVVRPASTAAQGSGRPITPGAPHLQPIRDKWAIVIGINRFQDKRIPELKYSVKDAQDFAEFLISKQHFARDHVLLLTNEDAGADAILDVVGDNWLPRRVLPGDLVLIYASTHGSPKEMDVAGENFLVAYDTKVDKLFSSAIKLEDLAPTIKKRTGCDRIVMILDACNSGAADVSGGKGIMRSQNFQVESFLGEGLVVVSSSSSDQRSWESQRYQNGVFTKRLMEALDTSGTTLSQAFESLKDKVEQEVRFDRKASQTPIMKSKWSGPDLVLAVSPAHPRAVEAASAITGTEQNAAGAITSATPVASSITGATATPSQVSTSGSMGTSTQSSTQPTPLTAGKPWMGVQLQELNDEIMKSMGLSEKIGVLVLQMVPNSPAEKAGFKAGDILRKIDGRSIVTPNDVTGYVRNRAVGDKVFCLVQRDQKVFTVPVVLGVVTEEFLSQQPNSSPLDMTGTPNGVNQSGPVSGSLGNGPMAANVSRNVQVLANRIAIFPFTGPPDYKLTRTPDYNREFTDQDRQFLKTMPTLLAGGVNSELASRLGNARVIPLKDLAQSISTMDTSNLGANVDSLKRVARAANAKYIVGGEISEFSFAGRVSWSNEYKFKTKAYIFNGETGQLVDTVQTTMAKTPWLADSNTIFTNYIYQKLLPELCKKVAEAVAQKMPRQ